MKYVIYSKEYLFSGNHGLSKTIENKIKLDVLIRIFHLNKIIIYTTLIML